MFEQYKKESPIISLLGMGGGVGSYIFTAPDTGYEIARSLRFNSADSAYLSRTPASAGNQKTWTWAGWVKRATFGTGYIFGCFVDGNDYCLVYPLSGGNIRFEAYNGGSRVLRLDTSNLFRDPSAWYHFVFTLDTSNATEANRAKIYVNGVDAALASSQYPTQNTDLQVNNTNQHEISSSVTPFNGYLADVHFIDGQALDPTSFGLFDDYGIWQPQIYTGEYGTNGFHLPFSDNSTAAALGTDTSGNGNDWTVNNISVTEGDGNYASGLTNNTGGFQSSYETVKAFDGSTSTSARTNNTTGNPTLTWTPSSPLTGISSFRIYNGNIGDNAYATGTITVNGGASLTYTDLGISSFTAQWVDLSSYLSSGTFTTFTITQVNKGSYTLGLDLFAVEVDGVVLIDNFYGSNNDILVDVPTNGTETDTGVGGEVRGNYATFNGLITSTTVTNARQVFSNGNLDLTSGASGNYGTGASTISLVSGKWYCEMLITVPSGADSFSRYGITAITRDFFSAGNNQIGGKAEDHVLVWNGGTTLRYTSNDTTQYTYSGASASSGSIFMLAYDADAGELWFGIDGTWLTNASGTGNPSTGSNPDVSGLSGPKYFVGGVYNGGTSNQISVNFGQRPFAYTAPSGFKALCTANLPAPLVTKPSEYMDVVTYTGNGSTQTISGLEFSPDFAWLKRRNSSGSHSLFDTVRGATIRLVSDSTAAETTETTALTAFTSDGFSLGSGGTANGSGDSFVAWTWDAGSSTVSNTDGSITSSVRANPSAGFSVVSFTPASSGAFTIGHGLGVAPSLVIAKSRNRSVSWFVYHSALSSPLGKFLELNSTAAVDANYASFWGTSSFSSTIFGMNTGVSCLSTDDMIAYCFAPVDGYSSFGSFLPNGTTDSSFVYLGFRPKYVLTKRSDGTGKWIIYDSARDTYNLAENRLTAEAADAENTTNAGLDFLSNGFKVRTSAFANGQTWIYAAFAESPMALNARAR